LEELSEFAGNLQAELLNVREDLRLGHITKEKALRRIRAIRRRARSGSDGSLRPQSKAIKARRVVKTREEVVQVASGNWDSLVQTAGSLFPSTLSL